MRANLVIRKLMIQMIATLEIMKIYVQLKKFVCYDHDKVGERILNFKIQGKENQTTMHNLRNLKSILISENLEDVKNLRFRVRPDLLKMNLKKLLAEIQLSDVSHYVLLTNLYMTGKENTRVVALHCQTKIQVEIKTNEECLFYKSKRKDELVKFSFKFIRKHILNRFRRSIETSGQKLKSRENKRRFDARYFGDKTLAKNYFYSMEVNKKNLNHLEESPEVIGLINSYVKDGFLSDQINYNIFNKNNNIFREDLTLRDFVRKIFVVQNKNNFTLQNILNSLYVFLHFFVFK